LARRIHYILLKKRRKTTWEIQTKAVNQQNLNLQITSISKK